MHDHENFSLMLGGSLFQLLRRVHLSDDALRLVRRRILFISLVAWLPLLLLSAGERHLVPGSATMPFLLDAEVHVRLLVALPLLIGAEVLVHRRLGPVARLFLERHLIPDSGMARFDAALAAASRLCNAKSAEVLMLALVYLVGTQMIGRQYLALDMTTWYVNSSASGTPLSIAGVWYGYVSLAIFQFLMCRWYFRLFIWARFLWQISRIELRLMPTHPDRFAGVGFLSNTVYAFSLLAAAHGALLAGLMANRIFFLGAMLTDFKTQFAALVILLLCIFCGPLLVFAPQLARVKRTGSRDYDLLAERYVRSFDAKWLRGGASADDQLVGSLDVQSLADMDHSVAVVHGMRLLLITRDGIIWTIFAIAVPIAPLIPTVIPFSELLKTLRSLLF
ncbi:MAG TPA: hypothetical protein DDZ81_00900 [Acetobacteraceae bacterium]|nr:hypothetical protein [Acetobacteraceae bacterium]